MIKEINMSYGHGKWLTLMNYIRHSGPAVYQLTFPDADTARRASRNIHIVIERNPTWFEVEIFQKGRDLLVIKKQYFQKAVVKGA